MESIGVRELRQNASQYLRLVERGETVQVTDRGRPVALLVPVPETPLERVRRLGILLPAAVSGGIDDIEPLEPKPGERPLSEILAEMRASERS